MTYEFLTDLTDSLRQLHRSVNSVIYIIDIENLLCMYLIYLTLDTNKLENFKLCKPEASFTTLKRNRVESVIYWPEIQFNQV
jgi:hypothetical protein